jgi:glycosyltransferase involved in cell wall biosynthesis
MLAGSRLKRYRVCNLSIIIKTLNEEIGISRTIESALATVEAHGGEVLIADSGSADSTVAIALQYPIKLVQLRCTQERRCGTWDSSYTIHGLAPFGNPFSKFRAEVAARRTCFGGFV